MGSGSLMDKRELVWGRVGVTGNRWSFRLRIRPLWSWIGSVRGWRVERNREKKF